MFEPIEKRPLGKVLKIAQEKGIKKQLAAVGDRLLDDLKRSHEATSTKSAERKKKRPKAKSAS